MRIRVIPTLLLHNGGLIKSIKFKDYQYVGDPINAVKIFNEKEVDEIALIDINATSEGRSPNIDQITKIAGEAFMPMSYGGGISNIEQIKEILYNGIEKIIINTAAHVNPNLISEAARLFGSQSVVVSIDVKKNIFSGYKVFIRNGSKNTGLTPSGFAKFAEELGAGEILLNSIDLDGTFKGYNINLIKEVSENVSIPVIAIGGAASVSDFKKAIAAGASAVAAGSMLIFQGPHRAVLISYPSQKELEHLIQ